MSVFGLARGFWIGNSHCALIRAPNNDSPKPINYSSRLDWHVPYNWVAAFLFSSAPQPIGADQTGGSRGNKLFQSIKLAN